jgi:hypothetical protein
VIRRPLIKLARSIGSCANRPSREPLGRGPFPGLLRPNGTSQPARFGLRGLCLPATFRPQGLATLSTAYSLAGFVECRSTRQRHRGSPFGAFSSSQVAGPFGLGLPRLPFFLRLRFDEPVDSPKLEPEDRLPGTSWDESLARGQVNKPNHGRLLPWDFPFQGLNVVALNRRSRRSPLTRLEIFAGYPARTPPPQSLDRRRPSSTQRAEDPS